jgi:hypothetical protein
VDKKDESNHNFDLNNQINNMKIVHIRNMHVTEIDYQRMMELQLIELKQLDAMIEKEIQHKKSVKKILHNDIKPLH